MCVFVVWQHNRVISFSFRPSWLIFKCSGLWGLYVCLFSRNFVFGYLKKWVPLWAFNGETNITAERERRERERPLDPWPIPQAALKLPFLFALLTQRPTSSLSLGSHSFTLLSICLTIRLPLFPFVLFPEPCNASSLNILWLRLLLLVLN